MSERVVSDGGGEDGGGRQRSGAHPSERRYGRAPAGVVSRMSSDPSLSSTLCLLVFLGERKKPRRPERVGKDLLLLLLLLLLLSLSGLNSVFFSLLSDRTSST